MDMTNKDVRRLAIRDLLIAHKFRLTNASDKSDEFKNSDEKAIYFFWKQGGGINIAIDPRLPFDALERIPGVELSKKNPYGIRGGTSMTDFPEKYQGFEPKGSGSKVGRMFVIEQERFADFMSTLVNIFSGKHKSKYDSADTQFAGVSGGGAKSTDIDEKGDVLNASYCANSSKDKSIAEEVRAEPEFDEAEFRKEIEGMRSNLEGQDVDAIVKRRVGHGIFRNRLLAEFGGACCMTGLKNIRLLIASHIVPWSMSEPTQKLDMHNGLLLSISMDALFDKGLISFADNGKILIGSDLDAETRGILGLDEEFVLPKKLLTDDRKKNLAQHRALHSFDASL